MNLAEIMDKSIDILKKYVATIIMFSIGYGVIMFLGLFIFMLVGGVFIAIFISVLKNMVFTIILISILFIIVIAFSLTLNIGIIKITSQEFFGEKIYASGAVGASFKSIIKVFGITIIALLTFIPAIGIFSAPVYFLYIKSGATYRSMNSNLAGVAMVIAIIICILYILAAIAVIIGYVTMFSFSLQALTIEKKGVLSSIKRSFNLVRSNFWRIYGCIILFGITIYAIQYSIISFLTLVISILFMILKFFNVQQSYTTFLTTALTYSNWPISLISWCIISPVAAIMTSLLYYNETFKKEGYDIVLKLKEIQKSQERDGLNASIEFNKSL